MRRMNNPMCLVEVLQFFMGRTFCIGLVVRPFRLSGLTTRRSRPPMAAAELVR